ncbi:hypothetical protein GCM10010168_42630 [Actinoplanes ianthinogenes]|uniref:Uncharacterized protein n=1 Tax=Actinoplanes ianthinogenes TaxID=122358 RepID=A0ABN6CD61_9ACTN|nr:hypothetical protein [Actinoplanes ianthinogenes]BCJ43427.1 hypothetical protein Aiant_40840 [Actinoplanes ianthinogenes]GGR20190.1 hypothetical protein GCM10010168_42630 [Actinoplanes ianthinogenes]
MVLLLKFLLAPLLVAGSTLAGRRWGPRVAGLLVTFPIVAGPILLITCLDHGPAFGARAASASLLGLITLALFAVVYAYAARRLGWLPALVLAWLANLAGDAVLAGFRLTAWVAFPLVLAAIVAAHRLVTGLDDPAAEVHPAAPPWWDLPARALATAALVLTVTSAAARLGPTVTGILAPFPIATSVIAAFVRAQQGPAATIRTLSGVTRGLTGFAVFCFLAAVLLGPLGTGPAFAAAVTGALLTQLMLSRAPVRRSAVAA